MGRIADDVFNTIEIVFDKIDYNKVKLTRDTRFVEDLHATEHEIAQLYYFLSCDFQYDFTKHLKYCPATIGEVIEDIKKRGLKLQDIQI